MEECKCKCIEQVTDASKFITGSDLGDSILVMVLFIIIFWLSVIIKHKVN